MNRSVMNHSRRHVILHYHFFKNAGTTVDSILKNNFRARFARFDSDDHNSVISNEALLGFLEAHGEVVALTSHHLRPPKPVDPRFVFHDILFLRHPVARLWSTYEFYRRAEVGKDPLTAAAKGVTAKRFFEALIADYPEHACNAQVNLVANAGHKLPTDADLARAEELVKAASVVGTAELFDESAVTAEAGLRPIFPAADFSYVPQNVSAGRPRSLADQLESVRQNCGEQIFHRLTDLNQLDLRLTEAATNEILRRLQQLKNPARQIRDLRSRCRAQEQAAARIILASNHPADFVRYANLGSR